MFDFFEKERGGGLQFYRGGDERKGVLIVYV